MTKNSFVAEVTFKPLKYWLKTLANLITFKAHDSSKDFNKLLVVTIKRNL